MQFSKRCQNVIVGEKKQSVNWQIWQEFSHFQILADKNVNLKEVGDSNVTFKSEKLKRI